MEHNNLRLMLVFLAMLVVYVMYVIVYEDNESTNEKVLRRLQLELSTNEEVLRRLELELSTNEKVQRRLQLELSTNEKLVRRLQLDLRTLNDTYSSSLHQTSDVNNGILHLRNVQANELELYSGRNIFFIVTTLTKNGTIELTARQACAIESAARTNPDWKVFPLFVFAKWFNVTGKGHLQSLLRLSNILPRTINLDTYAVGTPVEKLFTNGALNKSKYTVEHTADVLRIVTLYKYGGTYLDTDVIVRQSLNSLLPNYLGSEGRGNAGNAIINLEATGFGHQFAEACLNDLAKHFNGASWAANGPFMVTRNLRKFCNTTKVDNMTRAQCGGHLTVYPPDTFYRIRYPRHSWLFLPEKAKFVMNAIKNDVVVHMWNKATSKRKLNVTSKAPYIQLAHEFCPMVLSNCDIRF